MTDKKISTKQARERKKKERNDLTRMINEEGTKGKTKKQKRNKIINRNDKKGMT